MTAFVDRLILKLERNPDAKSVAENVDMQAFASSSEAARTLEELEALCAVGALKARYGRNGFKKRIERVTVLDAQALYGSLCRQPSSVAASRAVEPLKAAAEPWESPVLEEIERCWARHARWNRYGIEEAPAVVAIQKLCRALRHGLNEGQDMRTFSTRHGDDSKLIEREGPAILSYLYHGQERPNGSLREILARSGSVKITMPIMLSGAFSLRGIPVGSATDYSTVPVHDFAAFTLDRRPDYVLTVENLVSFHRHAVEVNGDRAGLVIFTSGQASVAWKAFYKTLVASLGGAIPFYHWSDIDAGGLEISRTIMALNPTVQPHLMSVELVQQQGQRLSAAVSDDGRFEGTWMAPLASYLSDPQNKSLEQESVDPCNPLLQVWPTLPVVDARLETIAVLPDDQASYYLPQDPIRDRNIEAQEETIDEIVMTTVGDGIQFQTDNYAGPGKRQDYGIGDPLPVNRQGASW